METQFLILAAALFGGLTTYTIFTRINLTLSTHIRQLKGKRA